MGGFADGLLKGTQARLNREQSKFEAKANEIKLKKLGMGLAEIADQFAAKQRLLQPDSRPTVNTPEGPPRPEETGITARIAQGQTDTIQDALRSGMLGELNKLKDFKAGTPALSPEGKLFQDIQRFGPQFKDSLAGDQIDPTKAFNETFGRADKLRDDFRAATKENVAGIEAMQRLTGIFETKPDGTLDFDPIDAGAADAATIFGVMKAFEPGNRITQGDISFAEDTSGAAGKFFRIYNRVLLGEKLTPAARQNLLFQAGQAAKGSIAAVREQEKVFTRRSERAKVNPDDVIFDSTRGIEQFIDKLRRTKPAAAKAVDSLMGPESAEMKQRLDAIERVGKAAVRRIFNMGAEELSTLDIDTLTPDEVLVVESAIMAKEAGQ